MTAAQPKKSKKRSGKRRASRPGAAAAGDDQQYTVFDDEADSGVDLFESEDETVTVERLRDLVREVARSPGYGAIARVLDDLGPEFVVETLKKLGRSSANRRIDEYGCDHQFIDDLWPLARWVHDKYFRVESRGMENVPNFGRVLLVANHSGTLPYDGAMVVAAVRCQHPSGRLVRPLVENFVYYMPFLGSFMARTGAVRACQENARRLLERDDAVLVFPEGVKGIGKLFRKRYQLQRFGRGGAIKLAMKTGAPIVPVSVVGAEESMPLLSKVSFLSRALGIPYIPVTPTLPFLGPLGLIPYPTKWYIDFGEPIDIAQYGREALGDRVLVNKLNERVRATIQQMIDRRLGERTSVWRG